MPRRADHTAVEVHKDVYRRLASEALERGMTVPQLIAQRAAEAPRGLDALERRVEMLELVIQETIAKKGRRRTA